MRSQPIHVRVSGPFALFTRPEMKVERFSYDVMTPSAARGILEAILWKPQMRWIIEQIVVLKPIRFVGIRRNEVKSKITSDFVRWARANEADYSFFADDDRQQRNSIVLRDVDYVVRGRIALTDKAGPDDHLQKYVEMFLRRVEKGQHFQQPYLGCREFPATVALAVGSEVPDEEVRCTGIDLGWMLHDLHYVDGEPKRPQFFNARLENGIVNVPRFRPEVES